VKSVEAETPAGDWFSAGVVSDGSYGIQEGLIFSFPVTSDGKGNWSIVENIELSDFARAKIELTEKELVEEKSVVSDLL
jgi:malate/lactate dehydrogenase